MRGDDETQDQAGLRRREGAARYLGVHPRTLDRLTERGELPAVRIGRRKLYRLETLERYAASRER